MDARRVTEAAMLMGACRKYNFRFDGNALEPIRSLRYFNQLITEIQKELLPSGYPTYLREKIKKLAALWDENVKSSSQARKEKDQPPSRETVQ